MMLISPFMSLGGADRFNIELLRGLSGRGWDLTVATTRAADHSLYRTYEEITADLFPAADVAAPFDVPLLLDYLIDSRRPDVVMVSQTELGYRLLPYLRSREIQPAFVDLCHSEDQGWYGGGFPRFSVEYGGLLDGTLVGSNHLRDWMVERGADADRIAVCHASVDHALFAPDPDARASMRRKLGISTDLPVVLWIGRISSEKRPELLPRISAALTARGLEHRLLVVGDGPERRATEAAAAAEPESRLLFLGRVDDGALPGIYAASDVIVLPSRREGIALTLFEAMSSGVPVVAAKIGGQAELVTPEVGFLIEPSAEEREVGAYATALSQVLREPDRRAAMSSAGRARIIAEFTEEATHDRIEHALEDALERHAHSPRPAPDAGLGRLIAAEAVELMRLQERGRSVPRRDPTRRERAYTLAQRIGGPLYRRSLSRGVPGLGLARDIAHRAIVGRDPRP
jgi:glycosyltransferase involved in cell wall biosynthesis